MTHSSKTFIFVFAAISAFCLVSSTFAQVPDFQQDELYAFLNSRYPNLYNRALRSMGKPTFIRFGKRSAAVPVLTAAGSAAAVAGASAGSVAAQQRQQQQNLFDQQQQQWSQY